MGDIKLNYQSIDSRNQLLRHIINPSKVRVVRWIKSNLSKLK